MKVEKASQTRCFRVLRHLHYLSRYASNLLTAIRQFSERLRLENAISGLYVFRATPNHLLSVRASRDDTLEHVLHAIELAGNGGMPPCWTTRSVLTIISMISPFSIFSMEIA